ncbi:hypothetical protein, partial [Allomesorhizobium camelthorni]
MPSGYSSGRSSIEREIAANSMRFYEDWLADLVDNAKHLSKDKLHVESFARLSALNGVISVVSASFDPESRKFLLEAQNDAVLSHVGATFGSWRLSLQSLRSFAENSLCALYYVSHPIELKLWERGKYRIGFRDLAKFMSSHPDLEGYDCAVSSVNDLEKEYAELSKAVHGSAKTFRMTDSVSDILLWDRANGKFGKWTTRQRNTISCVVVILLALFDKSFQGAQHLEIRRSLNFVLSATKAKLVSDQIKINIPKVR